MYASLFEGTAKERYCEVLREVEEDRLARIVAETKSTQPSRPGVLRSVRSLLRAYRLRVTITRPAA